MNMFDKLKKYNAKHIIQILDMRYGLGAIEKYISRKWFNPFATIYINFRCFPFLQAIKLPFFAYGCPKICSLSGEMRIEGCKVSMGMVLFNHLDQGGPSLQTLNSQIHLDGTIIFRGKCEIGCGTKIRVMPSGTIEFEDNVYISDFINIGCWNSIKIGKKTRIAHRSQLMDSSYHYIADIGKRSIARINDKSINIGNGVWVCNSSTLTGGTKIPDYCIVSSNSLVNKDFSSSPEGTIIGGIPAKVLTSSPSVRVFNDDWHRRLNDFFYNNPESRFYDLSGDVEIENFVY